MTSTKVWTNYYRCPCGEEWSDAWDCCCNDHCPSCDKEIEPYISDDGSVSEGDIEAARLAAIESQNLAAGDISATGAPATKRQCMEFNVRVESEAEYAELPVGAVFAIDEPDAREIVRLAAFVAANGLYKVEKFDYRTTWQARSGGAINSDADTLNITGTEFWFTAYTDKHTNTEMMTERLPVGRLKDHFGIG